MSEAESSILDRFADAAAQAGLDFVLVGGHALNARGVARTTINFDFAVDRADLDRWRDLLLGLGYRALHTVAGFAQFVAEPSSSLPIDLVLVDARTFSQLRAASDRLRYGRRDVPVASVLHLIAMKVHALRSADRRQDGTDYHDVLRLVRVHAIAFDSPELRGILQRHATADVRQRFETDLRLGAGPGPA